MRTKTRSDALWNELTPEQLEILDQWLFEDKLSFVDSLAKARSELGFKGSIGSLKRYYRRRSQERALENMAELMGDAAEVKELAGDVDMLRKATMKMVAAQAFQQVREAPEEAAKWGPAVKLMVEHDRNETIREGQKIRQELKAKDQEMRREFKAEDQRLRKEAMAFAKEKFEYRTAEAGLKALPQLLELREAKKDPQMRRAMSGPGTEVFPESAVEEEAMRTAKKEREERKAREAAMERNKVSDAQPPPPMNRYYEGYMQRQAERAAEKIAADWEKCPDYQI